jgi:GTP-binding protein
MRIIDATFLKSVTALDQTKGIDSAEICFVGRSNVGKSSLINSLVLRKVARTSSTPGATRLINLYRIRLDMEGAKREALFSDFPGFGYSKVARNVYESWQQMIEKYVTGNPRIRGVVWAFDVRREFDPLDRMLLEWFDEIGIDFSLVLTKVDKEGRGQVSQKRLVVQNIVGSRGVFPYSSKDGTGRNELLTHLGRNFLR